MAFIFHNVFICEPVRVRVFESVLAFTPRSDSRLNEGEESLMTKKILAVVALTLLTGAAHAGSWWGGWNWSPPRFNAPEIDPASAGSALTLLLGGLAVLRSRVTRKK
jgi:hypothetical protein